MEMQRSASHDEELFSTIILYCLKRCMNSPEMSSAIKIKILLIFYGDDNSIRAQSCAGKKFDENTKIERFNPLGIDEDTLDNYSECLTGDQGDCLRQLILEEVRKLHSFCTSIKKNIAVPSELNWMEQAEKLYSNIMKEVKGLECDSNLQNKLENLKLEGYKIPMQMKNEFISRATHLLDKERSLLEKIDQNMMNGERGEALEKVERLLEEKIRANRKKIQSLKFQLSEYST